MWAHSALFGMDGLLMAFGGTHLVLLSMSRMPWDTEAEGELVVGLSLEHEGLLFAFFGVVEYGMVLAGTLLLSLWLLPHTGYGATVMCVLVHTVLIRGKAVRLKVHQVVRSFSLLIYIPLYVELLVWLLPG